MEACFTVEGLEYVEVAKLTPAKGARTQSHHPGDPNPEDWRAAPPTQLRAVYAISPSGARNHLPANASLVFRFEVAA